MLFLLVPVQTDELKTYALLPVSQKDINKADNVKRVLIVPGSGLVKQQAEAEGLDKIFTAAGFEWCEPSCSMCLAMNADRLQSQER